MHDVKIFWGDLPDVMIEQLSYSSVQCETLEKRAERYGDKMPVW